MLGKTIWKSKFYYYDDRWNFPLGDNIGFYMIERDTNRVLDDKIKVTVFHNIYWFVLILPGKPDSTMAFAISMRALLSSL